MRAKTSRTQYAIRPLVDQADDVRRRAEDLFFIGDADSLREAEKGLG